MNIAVIPTKIPKNPRAKMDYPAKTSVRQNIRQTIHQKKRDRIEGGSPGDVSSVGASTDSGELTIKVGKLLDTWIDVKQHVDDEGEDFIQGTAIPMSAISATNASKLTNSTHGKSPYFRMKPRHGQYAQGIAKLPIAMTMPHKMMITPKRVLKGKNQDIIEVQSNSPKIRHPVYRVQQQ